MLGRWLPISLATMTAVLSIPAFVWAVTAEPAWHVLALAMCALVLVRHKHNLRRLRAGAESSAAAVVRRALPVAPDQPPTAVG